MNLDLLDDETRPTAPDVPSTSYAPPTAVDPAVASNSNIVDAIAVLFTHMNVIHTDLVERIGQVHKGNELIVECQAHDIVAIRDTLLAPSHRHTKFITEVNDFINSIHGR